MSKHSLLWRLDGIFKHAETSLDQNLTGLEHSHGRLSLSHYWPGAYYAISARGTDISTSIRRGTSPEDKSYYLDTNRLLSLLREKRINYKPLSRGYEFIVPILLDPRFNLDIDFSLGSDFTIEIHGVKIVCSFPNLKANIIRVGEEQLIFPRDDIYIQNNPEEFITNLKKFLPLFELLMTEPNKEKKHIDKNTAKELLIALSHTNNEDEIRQLVRQAKNDTLEVWLSLKNMKNMKDVDQDSLLGEVLDLLMRDLDLISIGR